LICVDGSMNSLVSHWAVSGREVGILSDDVEERVRERLNVTRFVYEHVLERLHLERTLIEISEFLVVLQLLLPRFSLLIECVKNFL
jgi:hypothetical protein